MALLAYALTVLKSMIYGASVFFTGALTSSVDVLDILSLRFLMTFAVLWLLKVTRLLPIRIGIGELLGRTERAPHMRSLLLTALFEPVLYMLFETLGISMVSSITAGGILSLQPISSVVFEAVILKERTTALQRVFLAVGIVGVICITVCAGGTGGSSVWGMLLLVGAVLSGSLYSVFSRSSSRHFSTMEITYVSAMLGAVVFGAINVVRHVIRGDIASYFSPLFDINNLIGFVFLAVLSSIVGSAISNFSLKYMQVSAVSAFGGVSTATTILIGALFLKEPLYMYHYIGLSLIFLRMVGVSTISIRRELHLKVPLKAKNKNTEQKNEKPLDKGEKA